MKNERTKNLRYATTFKINMAEYNCPKCGSKRLVLVLRVPWSTDGLMPKQKIFLRCEDCGYEIPVESD